MFHRAEHRSRCPIGLAIYSASLIRPLGGYGRSIAQHFGNPGHHVIGVIAYPDDGVGTLLVGVSAHQVEGILACSFTQLGVPRDVSAEQRFDLAKKLPTTERERTVIPRTTPCDRRM